MRLRLVLPLFAAVGVVAVVALFVAPAARASMLVDLLTGLAWPLVLLVAVIAFWPQLRELVAVVVARVQQGATVQFGMLSVGTAAEPAANIPSPSAAESVSLENIVLYDTSFLRPDETIRRDDGRTYYQIEVVVIAPDKVLDRIVSVTYDLPDAWPPHLRTRTVTDRASLFKLKELAYGTAIIRARVDLRGQGWRPGTGVNRRARFRFMVRLRGGCDSFGEVGGVAARDGAWV
jgi:hypothetical protein